MKAQNYKNHVRYYPPHHFVFYPVALAMTGFCIWKSTIDPAQKLIWWMLAAIVMLITWASFMMRQHYALINQNRTVRLELRFRYYALTNTRLEPLEDKLTNGQLFALRFASDAELPALVRRAVDEGLAPDEIKRSIVDWLPDHMRV